MWRVSSESDDEEIVAMSLALFLKGDERLLYKRWKLSVTRSRTRRFPQAFRALGRGQTTQSESWVSNPFPPLIATTKLDLSAGGNLSETLAHPPTAEGKTPSFTKATEYKFVPTP